MRIQITVMMSDLIISTFLSVEFVWVYDDFVISSIYQKNKHEAYPTTQHRVSFTRLHGKTKLSFNKTNHVLRFKISSGFEIFLGVMLFIVSFKFFIFLFLKSLDWKQNIIFLFSNLSKSHLFFLVGYVLIDLIWI